METEKNVTREQKSSAQNQFSERHFKSKKGVLRCEVSDKCLVQYSSPGGVPGTKHPTKQTFKKRCPRTRHLLNVFFTDFTQLPSKTATTTNEKVRTSTVYGE